MWLRNGSKNTQRLNLALALASWLGGCGSFFQAIPHSSQFCRNIRWFASHCEAIRLLMTIPRSVSMRIWSNSHMDSTTSEAVSASFLASMDPHESKLCVSVTWIVSKQIITFFLPCKNIRLCRDSKSSPPLMCCFSVIDKHSQPFGGPQEGSTCSWLTKKMQLMDDHLCLANDSNSPFLL